MDFIFLHPHEKYVDFTKYIKNNNTLDLSGSLMGMLVTSSEDRMLDVINEMTEFLTAHPHITKLSLASCFNYGVFGNAKAIKEAGSSAVLMHGSEITNLVKLIENIKAKKLSQITDFDFSNNNINTDIIAILSELGNGLPNLERLNLESSHINDNYGSTVLRRLAQCNGYLKLSKLKELNLANNNIDSDGIKYLLTNLPQKLMTFEETKALLPDETNERVLEVVNTANASHTWRNYFQNMESLNLSDNHIDDKAIHKLAKKLYAMPKLHSLNLESNQISKAGYAELLHSLKINDIHWESLSVANNTAITLDLIDSVNERLNSENYSTANFTQFINDLYAQESNYAFIQHAAESYNQVAHDIDDLTNNNPNVSPEIVNVLQRIQKLHADHVTEGVNLHLLGTAIQGAGLMNNIIGQINGDQYDSADDDDGSCSIM